MVLILVFRHAWFGQSDPHDLLLSNEYALLRLFASAHCSADGVESAFSDAADPAGLDGAGTGRARALSPTFDALAATMVRSSSPDKVRLQLLFNKGTVLPIEMNADAGLALSGGLVEYFGAKQTRYAPRKNSSAAAG